MAKSGAILVPTIAVNPQKANTTMISQKEKEEWRRRADVEDVVALGCFVFFIMMVALSFLGLYEGVLGIFNYTRS